MTEIVRLQDIGSAAKPEGDTFGSAELNKIYQAMKYVLRVLTTTQANIRPDRVCIGDEEAGAYRDADGNMVLFDPLAGSVKLSQLGGAVFAHGPWLGDPVPCPDHAYPTINRLYLRFVTAHRDETISGIAIGLWEGDPATYDNAMGGVYDTSGTLLRGGTSVPVSGYLANNILPLTAPLNLTAGNYWLAVIFESASGFHIYGGTPGGHNAKYYAAGSYTLPASFVIPATWADVWVPGFLGVVNGGFTF